MIKTVFWLLYLVGYMTFAMFLLAVIGWHRKRGNHERATEMVNYWVPRWAADLLRATGSEVTVTGLQNLPDGGFMMMGNHQSFFDIPALLLALGRPYGFIAKSSLDRIPALGHWMREIGCVSICREDPRGAMAMLLDQCVDRLQQGGILCIFPEGTRSGGGEVKPFKKGGFVTAINAGAPIVPVAIEGTYHLWEEHHAICAGQIRVSILPTIYPDRLSDEQREMLPLRLRKEIAAERERLVAELARQNEEQHKGGWADPDPGTAVG
ncbi:MAG: 1-acyl-sn-glycerol-3-phosphate acyltransferase [Clostridia bacterium]|nr:1-acyl-sn-glycerol-3-phosphate acyltransferase [Clostridia bacterium]